MAKKIILLGFMGCGKSTIGKALAKKLHNDFIDLDDEIEKAAQMSISKIFEKYGEQHFREQETKTLIKVLAHNKEIVLALGGGTPCHNNNLRLINTYPSFYIRCGVDVLTKRLQKEKAHRPVIAAQTKASLKSFIAKKLGERRAFYNKARFTVVGSRMPKDIVLRIENLS